MSTPKVFEKEYEFLCILWENEPIKSTALAKLCKERLNWVKGATYTVIKRLVERGVIRHENTYVSSLVSKEDVRLSEFVGTPLRRIDPGVPFDVLAQATVERRTGQGNHGDHQPGRRKVLTGAGSA